MIDSNLPTLSLEAAHKILKQFEGLEQRQATEAALKDETVRQKLRQAVAIAASHSDYQILGICSDTWAEGCQALQSYAEALRYLSDLDLPLQSIEGAVYIKFNPQLGSCYADAYSGHHRGVLVSCQSAAAPGINEMYGHLPLDLFEAS
ncbi:MAG: DUF1824 family protein [Oscillatoriophycideae cyanobacterium NC_groundwater_1537_Pr4_S-0.65um_50_18]|nr:DUF1824 family protein [Oscillatoriophycideae cyanobacterium NC_groundwater_1537_Pr4_S-0.65um_50_18]